MALDDDEIDLAAAALLLSRQAGARIKHKRYLQQIDDMAYAVLDALQEHNIDPRQLTDPAGQDSAYARAIIAQINKQLFEKAGFKAVDSADEPKDLFLHYVLDRKRGYCLSLSIVYLAIGERLGLPLYGVVVPGHFFVRYDNGRTRFNIETTSRGGSATDEHYIKKFGVPTANGDAIYMKNLTKKQTLSCFFNNLGNVYQSLGDIDSALILLRRAVRITPSLSMVRANLGNLYLKKGWTDDAIAQYRIAMDIYPGDPKTHNNLGNAYFRQNLLDQAEYEYQTSLTLDPNFAEPYKNLAVTYRTQQQYDKALQSLNKALALDSKDSQVYHQIAETYRQMADYDAAVSYYQKALQLKPDLVEAYLGLALTYNKQGCIDSEIQTYKKLLALSADERYTLAALQNLGNAYIEKKMYDAAVTQYKKALLINDQDELIYYTLAVAKKKKKNYRLAVDAYLNAIDLNPDLAEAHHALAACYYVLKEYDLGFEHIETARQLGFNVQQDLYAELKKKTAK